MLNRREILITLCIILNADIANKHKRNYPIFKVSGVCHPKAVEIGG